MNTHAEGLRTTRAEHSPGPRTIRILVSSPGDVHDERDCAKRVVQGLQRRYAGIFTLEPFLWEDLPLSSIRPFQAGIEYLLEEGGGIDIAIFILWSRLGSPPGREFTRSDGTIYQSGTEREYDLMKAANASSGGVRPHIMFYVRKDDASADERQRGRSLAEQREMIEQRLRVEQFIEREFTEPQLKFNRGAYVTYRLPKSAERDDTLIADKFAPSVSFTERLREHLRRILDGLQATYSSNDQVAHHPWDASLRGPPFMGLDAFQPKHAEVFFGRDEEIENARTALLTQAKNGCAFLLLAGASGSGKSSLARAGILPAIVTYEVDALPAVPSLRAPPVVQRTESELVSAENRLVAWRSLIITPSELGAKPMEGFVDLLASESALPELDREHCGALPEDLRSDPQLAFQAWFVDAFSRANAHYGGGMRVLLVVDQLEELFAWDVAERRAFLDTLEVFARSGQIWVLATIRSDFFPQVQAEDALVRMKAGSGLMDVRPPGIVALRALIEEPARLAGLKFEARTETSAENRKAVLLSDVLLADAAEHGELLPLVEHALRELYERRTSDGILTFAAYKELGKDKDRGEEFSGIQGAVANHANALFRSLYQSGSARCQITNEAAADAALAKVLQALVTMGQGSGEGEADDEPFVRRRARLDAFAEGSPERELVDVFATGRLLTTDRNHVTQEPFVWLAHESVLRVWPRALEWATLNRDFLRTRARLDIRMKSADGLLDGGPLLSSCRFHLQRDASCFEEAQRDFINRSLSRLRRNRVLLSGGATGGATAVLLAILYFFFGARAAQLTAEAERELARQDYGRAEIAAAKALTYRDSNTTRELLLKTRSGGMGLVAGSAVGAPDAALASFSGDGHVVAVVVADAGGAHSAISVLTSVDEKERWQISIPPGSERPDTLALGELRSGRRMLAVARADHVVEIWTLPQGKPAERAVELSTGSDLGRHSKRVPSVVFHPSKDWVLTSSEDRRLCLWDYGTNPARLLWQREHAHDTAVHGVTFNTDGTLIASGGGDYRIKIWRTDEVVSNDGRSADSKASEPMVLEAHTDSVFAVAFSPDGTKLASGGYDRVIRLWDMTAQRPRVVGTLAGHQGTVLALAFGRDNMLLMSGGKDETARVWFTPEARTLLTLTSHKGVVRSLAFHDLNERTSVGAERGWSSWSPTRSRGARRIWSDGSTVGAIAFDPQSKTMVSGGGDGRLRVWDKDYHVTYLETYPAEGINGVAFSHDGRWLAAAGEAKRVFIWRRLANGGFTPVAPPTHDSLVHEGAVWGLCFDPRGRWLFSGNTDNNRRIRRWRMSDWRKEDESPELRDAVYTLACDAERVVSGDSDGRVMVWSNSLPLTKISEMVNVSQGGEKNVWSVAIAGAPLTILSGNSDGYVHKWIPEPGLGTGRGQKMRTSDEDAKVNHTINSVAYTPERGWVAAAGDGASVEIYDAQLKRLFGLQGHEGTVWYVSFDVQGQRIAYGGADRILYVHELEATRRVLETATPSELYAEASQITGLDLIDGKIELASP